MKNIAQVIRKSPHGGQVVMFPFGGGTGYSYMELIKTLETEAEIIVINPPGRLFDQGRPLESITAMVSLYSDELRPLLRGRPLFFGHSIGGIVAHEMCRALPPEHQPHHIIISSVTPPHRIMDDVDLRSDMDTPELIDKSTRLGGMPEIFKDEPEMMEMFVKGLRSDLKALENHHPTPSDAVQKLNINAVIVYGDSDYIVSPEKIREWNLYLNCSQFIRLPGDHFYLYRHNNRLAVAELISRFAIGPTTRN